MFVAPLKSRYIDQIQNIGVSKISDHIQINIKMPKPSQEPPASSKAQNEDCKDIDVICTFKIKIESKFGSLVYQRPVTIAKSISRYKIPVKNLQHPTKPQMRI